MIATRSSRVRYLNKWSSRTLIIQLLFVTLITYLYHTGQITLAIPWLPVSVIGTAVAFYVGFKNNQSYDRMWEARKIWGGIVNSSRTWAIHVDGYVTNIFRDSPLSDTELHEIKKRLIYKHIAWTYQLRKQLLVPAPWESAGQKGKKGLKHKKIIKRHGLGSALNKFSVTEVGSLMSDKDYKFVMSKQNPATHIIDLQSKDLRKLREDNILDNFGYTALKELLHQLYQHQGKCERIKKFPLPRQYANLSEYFVTIFIALIPFSMIPEMMKIEHWMTWLSVPITAIISWVYIMMEFIGDQSENPFQGMPHDIPMLSICRNIEIDLREMLGEKDLPEQIESIDGILM